VSVSRLEEEPKAGAPEEEKGKGDGGKRSMNSLLEFVLIVVVALGLALGIQAWVVKPFRIPSGSMEPTLAIGQRVLVDRVTGHFGDPGRGDIVVFKPPKGAADSSEQKCGIQSQPADGHPCSKPTAGQADQNFIKRVVGLPGDHLKVLRGRVYINGKLNDPFEKHDVPCEVCDLPKEITIPPGSFSMRGDNRAASDDSRYWGPVPKKSLVGEAFFTYWPLKRVGTL
jgi:signal peptidase I